MPIIFLEFARPRDFIKAFLLLFIGIYLILTLDILKIENILIFTINSAIIILLVVEVFTNRLSQLSEKEKKDIRSFKFIKNKLIVFSNAVKITYEKIKNNIFKPNALGNDISSKKWVRSNKKDLNDNPEKVKDNYSSSLFLKTTNTPKQDIMKDEKI